MGHSIKVNGCVMAESLKQNSGNGWRWDLSRLARVAAGLQGIFDSPNSM